MSKSGSANVRVRYLGPAPVKQNPAASEPLQPTTDSFASTNVMDESLPPVVALAPTPAPVAAAPSPAPSGPATG